MDVAQLIILSCTWACFVVTGVLLAKWDIREHRLPNRYVMWAFFGGLLGFTLSSALSQSLEPLFRAGLAATSCVLIFTLVHIFGGMGMGDVKYAGVIGLYLGWIGWESVYWGVFGAFILAAMFVLVTAVCKRPQRKIPFGPFMTLGAIVTSAISTIP